MTRLISLSDHNRLISESVADPFGSEAQRNGIACPKCGAELLDCNPNRILLSLPPKKAVRCGKCEYKGERLC